MGDHKTVTAVCTLIVINATAYNDGPYCEGGTINLTGGPDGMASYSWEGPLEFSSSSRNATIPGATTGMAGAYNLTVTDANGCSDDASTDVVVNVLPTAEASNDGPECEGGDIQLNGGPDDMTSYSWEGPNEYGNSSQSPLLSSVTTADAGTYTLTVINGTCTSDPVSTVVVVDIKPTAEASNDGPECEGGDIQLNGGPDDMTSYSWEGPNEYGNSSQSP
ncbi:unnamed protein product, partial [marine sediment metagenome]